MPDPFRAIHAALLLMLMVISCGENTLTPVEELPRQSESTNFVYHYESGDYIDATWQEAYHKWLLETLEVQLSTKLHYFKYRNAAHLRELTGSSGNGFADSRQYSFHTISPIDNHESVHVVVFNTVGRASALFDEGIAVAHQTDAPSQNYDPLWNGKHIHTLAREYRLSGEIPSLDQLLTSTAFRNIDANKAYPLAGSFVRYLIDHAELDTLKMFISRSGPDDRSSDIRDTFQQAYGQSVDQLWEQWLTFLDIGEW